MIYKIKSFSVVDKYQTINMIILKAPQQLVNWSNKGGLCPVRLAKVRLEVI